MRNLVDVSVKVSRVYNKRVSCNENLLEINVFKVWQKCYILNCRKQNQDTASMFQYIIWRLVIIL